jgi:dipeptidase D
MNAKVREIIECFEKINEFPRCSGNEAAISAWLCEWATQNGFTHRSDAAGNLIIDVPPSAGYEAAPGVIFQAHMDMVCEKTPDSKHDFSKDPIHLVTRGEWLSAKDTSIGADNGAAIALGMVLVTDPAVKHPPLELLFTVDEESGLKGAKKLPDDFIRGRILLNVDSEDEGVFTIGCAGGTDTLMTRDFELAAIPGDHVLIDISAGGMRGGHSGIDIGKHRANANKVLARLLAEAGRDTDIRLAALEGGTKHNAIPREARAVIALPGGTFAQTEKRIVNLAAEIEAEYLATEKNLTIRLTKTTGGEDGQSLSPTDTLEVVAWLLAMPNGVQETVPGDVGRVETSCNTAVIGLAKNRVSVLVSQRSAVMSRLRALNAQVEAVAAMLGAHARTTNQYPAWPVRDDDPLVERCRQVYKACFGREPIVEVIHAGLECAVIGAKYPGMDMISFGPTMKNPHSPDEKLNIPSMGKLWDFLVALMASFKS